MKTVVVAGWLAMAVGGAASAAPLQAALECRPADVGGPVYDCVVRLAERGSGKPVTGASLTVSADMPSMPMAHNPRPVPAEPQGAPGVYRARLALAMYGAWRVKLNIARPAPDRIVLAYDFFDTP
jgi:hypothetical protein